jgi:hypothetical protein
MQLIKLLHKTLEKELPEIHKTRLKKLMDATATVIRTGKLTLTGLGRNLSKKNKPRSNIKKAIDYWVIAICIKNTLIFIASAIRVN